MKTEELLNLDCTKEENIKKLNRFLYKIKPLEKVATKHGYNTEQNKMLGMEVLEEVLHGLCLHYGYMHQGICVYYEHETDESGKNKNKRFVFYRTSVITPDRQWAGEVYGKTLWEIMAKIIVKIYVDIKSKKG
jgi:hypothetical protein